MTVPPAMPPAQIPGSASPFDAIKRTDERGDHWFGRELMPLLDYDKWENFAEVIEKARVAIAAAGGDPDAHASCWQEASGRTRRMNYRLTRYGAYVVGMVGDVRKAAVGRALTYFAVKTHQAETAPVVADVMQLSDRDKLALLAQGILDAQRRESDAINRAEVSEAALEAAAPAIEYVERYVDKSQVVLIDKWAAGYGLTGPQARKLLVDRNIIYRSRVGWRWSDSKQRMVEEFEYRARAGRVTFDWFDLRPQHNAPLMHNGQLRHTLYVRQAYALDLGRKVGLAPVAGTDVVLRDGAA